MKQNTKKWLIFYGLKVLELMGLGVIIFLTWLNTLWFRNLECTFTYETTLCGMGFITWSASFLVTFAGGLILWGLILLIKIWIERNLEVAKVLSESKRKR